MTDGSEVGLAVFAEVNGAFELAVFDRRGEVEAEAGADSRDVAAEAELVAGDGAGEVAAVEFSAMGAEEFVAVLLEDEGVNS